MMTFSIYSEAESHGINDLVEHIEQFQKQKQRAHFKSNKLIANREQFLSEWTMHSKRGPAGAISAVKTSSQGNVNVN